MALLRLLFLSDTHLGFDDPLRPRVARRRRGPDFFANFERALEPARRGEVDLVVHGGDLLYRSRVPPALVDRAFRPLKAVADTGVPVYVVPGNHERSRIPYPLLAQHENVFILDRPRHFLFQRGGFRLALGGFPYLRGVRDRFRDAYRDTGLETADAHAALLLMHHAVQGARVGPGGFTFRSGADVVRARDIPRRPAAVLSGHIHRAQALVAGLATPVVYPGSIERTSFAEAAERKGYLTLAIETEGMDRGRLRGWRFHELPTRPMVRLELAAEELMPERIGKRLVRLPADAVVQITAGDAAFALPPIAVIRAMAPDTMSLSVALRRREARSSRHSGLESARRSERARWR